MSRELVPSSFWDFPRFPALFDEDWFGTDTAGGLELSEDDGHVYVKAHVPGIDPKAVEVTYEKGVLAIRGHREEQEGGKGQKVYRRARSSFAYQVAVPGNVDESADPEAHCVNGVCTVTFTKRPEKQPKRIAVKTE